MVLMFLLTGPLACSSTFGLQLRVVGESGQALPDATVEVLETVHEPGLFGTIDLAGLEHPVLAIVSAPGHLSEPVPLGRTLLGEVEVRLHSDAGGTRIVVHAGGDVMLGRRYVEPADGPALLVRGDGGASARAIVSDLADAYSLADLSLVNLESVVGELPDEDAYPGKRWLLQTPLEGLDALQEAGTDVVSLANNHQRDWLDVGVGSTLDAVDNAGFDRLGAGLDAEEAAVPLARDVGGARVAVLAWTSVDGDYVNDAYPRDDDTAPADADWKWDAISWGEPDLGIPVAERRIGSAWDSLVEAEGALSEADSATLWASAETAYPELQDWVARRGHGGGNLWDSDSAEADIAAARAEADLVVVQLHMGFQFATAPGEGVREAAYAAIDAGADLVVAHHPHVLQGMEWYNGKLIAWSLGNLIFDQDFLTTFASAFLRTIWEEDGTLVEARVVPLLLDAYRPVPAVDQRADNTLRSLWQAGYLEAVAMRGTDDVVRAVRAERVDDAVAAEFAIERGTAVIQEGGSESTLTATLTEGVPSPLPPRTLVWGALSDPAPAGVDVGRSLQDYGGFEDTDADGESGDTPGWTWSSPDVSVTSRGAGTGVASLELIRSPVNTERVSARMAARVPLSLHRVYRDADGFVPLDGDASYSIRLQSWISGEVGLGEIRVDLYHFDDTDPTIEPESVLLRSIAVSPETTEGAWVLSEIDLDPDHFVAVDGLAPNAALLYVSLNPPSNRTTVWRVDDLELIEWREAALEPATWSAIDWVRGAGTVDIRIRESPAVTSFR